jgi:hypothetical protein
MLDARLPHLPDDWAVWAFSDAHGVTSGLVAALQEAGLVDDAVTWIAPPRTALVGCGDYLDRGGDIPGLVAMLRRLETEAVAAGGAVVLARGNHEVMPLMARDGALEWLDTWLDYGGRETVRAFSCGEPDPVRGHELLAAMDRCAPGLFAWMDSLAQAVRWRDVLFVHGGLAPAHCLEDLGVTTDEHLWVRSGFFDTPWDSDVFDAYRAAGIERVVFGHTPQWTGPTFHHEGHSLGIDTNAVGNPRMPGGAVQQLTLLGLSGSGTFEEARLIGIPTADAPDRLNR